MFGDALMYNKDLLHPLLGPLMGLETTDDVRSVYVADLFQNIKHVHTVLYELLSPALPIPLSFSSEDIKIKLMLPSAALSLHRTPLLPYLNILLTTISSIRATDDLVPRPFYYYANLQGSSSHLLIQSL